MFTSVTELKTSKVTVTSASMTSKNNVTVNVNVDVNGTCEWNGWKLTLLWVYYTSCQSGRRSSTVSKQTAAVSAIQPNCNDLTFIKWKKTISCCDTLFSISLVETAVWRCIKMAIACKLPYIVFVGTNVEENEKWSGNVRVREKGRRYNLLLIDTVAN